MRNSMTFIPAPILAIIYSTLIMLGASHSAMAQLQKIGVVGNMTGIVTATSLEGASRPLAAGEDIYLNDTIASELGAKAQIMFLDKSALMINPDTKVTVDRFVFDPATASGELSINNAKGALRFIGGALSKKKPVKIKTPVATIGIRGGIADTHVAANGQTDAIFVFGEEMSVTNSAGQSLSVTTPGQGLGLANANSLPSALPPARVKKLLSTFSGTDGKAKGGEGDQDAANNSDGAAPDTKRRKRQARKNRRAQHYSQNANHDARRNNGNNNFNNQSFNPTDFGKYVLTGTAGQVVSAGISRHERNGAGFAGRLTQTFPANNAGNQFVSGLPWLKNGGYQTVANAVVAGRGISGDGYRSYDQSMQFYDLTDGEFTLRTLFGRDAAVGTWATSAASSAAFGANSQNGLTFYDFLPDLAGFGTEAPNFFGYNMASEFFRSGNGVGNDNLGLVVNWNTNRFITGRIDWNDDGAGPKRGLTLSFGKTNAGGRLLDGRVYEYLTLNNGGGTVTHSDSGFLRTDQAYSVTDGSAFSGFLVEGILPNNDNIGSGNAFDNATQGPRIFQGAVQGAINSDASDSAAISSGNVQKGFAAGFIMKQDEYGATIYHQFGNDDANDVVITPNAAQGNVSARMELQATNGLLKLTPTIEAHFGNSGGQTADSAYLTDKLYAAQQSKYIANDGISSDEYTGDAVQNGALVAGSLISEVSNECTACEYVTWGVWAGEIDRSAGGTNTSDFATLIPYVSGQITPKLNLPTGIGNVTYNGAMYGSVLSGNSLNRAEGSFSAGINMNTRQLTDFDANFAGMNFGFNGQAHDIGTGSSQAVFHGIAVHNLGAGGTNLIDGGINGALFGPAGEDIGGNFSVNHTGDGSQAAGVYLGTR